MKRSFILFLMLSVFSFVILAGCAALNQRSKFSSSVPLSSFIKPVSDSRQIDKKTPLTFPVSVSILFIPGGTINKGVYTSYGSVPYTTLYKASQELKKQLLANPKYISSVSIIQGDETSSMISLNDIRSSYATDVVIILSYKQDQSNSQTGAAGLADVTIVGAFVVPGVKINTTTLVDAKIIHIPNNAIIFRTSATNEHSTHSTSYTVESTATEESINGILAATTEIGNSLNKTLTKFDNYDMSQAMPMANLYSKESQDKQSNDYWQKVDTYKSSGGGAFGFIPFLMALAICGLAWRRK